VADPFGRGDLAKNTYLQRADGPAHVIIEMDIWRAMCGVYADDDCGVRVVATGAGALLFSNARATIATVIPTNAFERVMRRYAVDDRFARTMRDSGSQTVEDPICGSCSQSAVCQTNWFNIRSSTLATEGLPPCDTVRNNDNGDSKDNRYWHLPTMEELPVPEMGLDPAGYIQRRMCDSEVASQIRLGDIVHEREDEIVEVMEDAKLRVAERLQTLTDWRSRRHVWRSHHMEVPLCEG
jgi:hypothetical protein